MHLFTAVHLHLLYFTWGIVISGLGLQHSLNCEKSRVKSHSKSHFKSHISSHTFKSHVWNSNF